MTEFLRRATLWTLLIIVALACLAVGLAYGTASNAEELRNSLFELLGLLGTWLSGIGALLAVYIALDIASRQRRDALLTDKVRGLHHSIAIVNDLRGRITSLQRTLEDGGKPLAALTINCDGLQKRYESLFDREIYAGLSGHLVDRIVKMSGWFHGLEVIVAVIASTMNNELHLVLPPRQNPEREVSDPFIALLRELDDLLAALYDERKELDKYAVSG